MDSGKQLYINPNNIRLMRTELDNGTIIEKDDNDSFTVTAWGYPEVMDKDGQKLSVDEIIADTPLMMAHKPKAHLGHTDTEVGPILDVWKAEKTLENGSKVPATRVKYGVYGTRRFHKAVRRKIERGELGMVSIKGYAYGKSTVEDHNGKKVVVPHDLEVITYAVCKQGKNPEANVDSIMVAGQEIMKSDDLELLTRPEILTEVRTFMNDGMTYTEAMKTVKETYTDDLHKELLSEWDVPEAFEKMIKHEGNKYNIYDSSGNKKLGSHDSEDKAKKQLAAIEAQKLKKGEDMPDDDIEAIKKELEALKKNHEELEGKYDSLTKEHEAITKERDDLKATVEKGNDEDEDTPDALTKEQVEEIVKSHEEQWKEEFMKGVKENPDEIMKALGFQKGGVGADVPNNKPLAEISKAWDGEDKEGLKEFYNIMQKAKNAYLNDDIDTIPSAEDMEKEFQKDDYGYADDEGGE